MKLECHGAESIRTATKGRDGWRAWRIAKFASGLLLTCQPGIGVQHAIAHPSSGIVVDSTGAVIFADERRNIVFRVDKDGKQTQWITPKHCHELFLDRDGSLYGEHQEYLPESNRWRSSIWRRDTAGKVTDVYGPAPGFAPGLLLDSDGNRYHHSGNEKPNGQASLIVRRAPNGTLTTLAGGPPAVIGGRGDEAKLGAVGAMAWGKDRSIYFVEDDAVRRVTMEGVVTTLARGFREPKDPDLPTQRLWGLAVAKTGAAYVADYGNRRVIKVTLDGAVTTVLRAEKPWSPTGVALNGDELVVLEHGFTPPSTSLGPRVRSRSLDGTIRVLTTIDDLL